MESKRTVYITHYPYTYRATGKINIPVIGEEYVRVIFLVSFIVSEEPGGNLGINISSASIISGNGVDRLLIYFSDATIENSENKIDKINKSSSYASHEYPSVNAVIDFVSNFANSATTKNRPKNVDIGYMVFDTTLSKPIWWTGSKWVNASGTQV